jgi:hypothetical protein
MGQRVVIEARLGIQANLLEAAAVVAITGAAAVVRLVPLFGGQPGGLYPDEAAEGLSALRILADPLYRPVFVDENGGREALFAYLVAGTFHFTGPTVTGIRLTSALIGLVGILATWLLLRRFGRAVALVGITWMAGSPWMIATSVLGLRNGLTVPFAALAGLALLAWADRPRRSYALLAGLAVGFGVWTYQPLKLTPLLVGAWLLWLRHSDRPLFDRLWTDRLWLLLGYLVALAPYLWTALSDPVNYFGRIAGVSPLAPDMRRAGFLLHTLDTFGMFFVAGDPNPRHDISALPVLLWPLPLLAALGLWYAVRRRHNPAFGLVLVALGVYLLPALLALEGDAPHLQRSLALAPFIAALVGVGLVELVRLVRPTGRPLAVVAGAAGAIALLLTGIYGGLAFALRPLSERYAAFDYHAVALAAAGAQPGTAVIVNLYDAQTVRFLDGPALSIFLPGEDVPGDVALAALNRDDLPAARRATATVYARDPSSNPAVWIAPIP